MFELGWQTIPLVLGLIVVVVIVLVFYIGIKWNERYGKRKQGVNMMLKVDIPKWNIKMKSCKKCSDKYTDCRGYKFCNFSGAIRKEGFGYLGHRWSDIKDIPKWCPKKDKNEV